MRSKGRLVALAGVLLALLAVVISAHVVPTSQGRTRPPVPARPTSPASPISRLAGHPVRFADSHSIYWGASIKTPQGQAPWNMNIADQFGRLTGKNVSIISWGSLFYSPQYCTGWCNFQTTQFDAVRGYGAIPMLSWGPNWSRSIDAKVANGDYDSYLITWAKAAKAWGHPFFLRFAWEMNGDWFPWGVGRTGVSTEGNTPATYVAMWRHVYNLFHQVGANNVTWVWCPNVNADTTYEPLSSLYPGNAYVNWTGLDGYNRDNPWRSFPAIYAASYADVGSFAPTKPMVIGEVASTEAGGSKANWIQNMFETLPSLFPIIRGLLWYQDDQPGPRGRGDWTVNTSPSALSAFKAGLSSPLYQSNAYSSADTSPIPPP